MKRYKSSTTIRIFVCSCFICVTLIPPSLIAGNIKSSAEPLINEEKIIAEYNEKAAEYVEKKFKQVKNFSELLDDVIILGNKKDKTLISDLKNKVGSTRPPKIERNKNIIKIFNQDIITQIEFTNLLDKKIRINGYDADFSARVSFEERYRYIERIISHNKKISSSKGHILLKAFCGESAWGQYGVDSLEKYCGTEVYKSCKKQGGTLNTDCICSAGNNSQQTQNKSTPLSAEKLLNTNLDSTQSATQNIIMSTIMADKALNDDTVYIYEQTKKVLDKESACGSMDQEKKGTVKVEEAKCNEWGALTLKMHCEDAKKTTKDSSKTFSVSLEEAQLGSKRKCEAALDSYFELFTKNNIKVSDYRPFKNKNSTVDATANSQSQTGAQ